MLNLVWQELQVRRAQDIMKTRWGPSPWFGPMMVQGQWPGERDKETVLKKEWRIQLLWELWVWLQMRRPWGPHQNQISWHTWRESTLMDWSICDVSRWRGTGSIGQTPGSQARGPTGRRLAGATEVGLNCHLSAPGALTPLAPISASVSWGLLFPSQDPSQGGQAP